MRAMVRILSIVVLLTIPFNVGSAQEPIPTPALITTYENLETAQYFSIASLPRMEEIQTPPKVELGRAARIAKDIMSQRTRSAMHEISRLKRQDRVVDYNLMMGDELISLQVNAGSSLRELPALRSVELFETAEQAVACSQKYQGLLREQIMALSRAQEWRNQGVANAPLTDPSIDVYAPAGSEWTYIKGITTPSTGVSVVIRRGGRIIGSGETTSSLSGYYYFYPEWRGGCEGDYNWSLQAGDVVEVTAHGSTVSMIVAYLSAWMDPSLNTVSGQTTPGALVEAWVYNDLELCTYSEYGLSGLSDGSGNFTLNFSGTVNFSRSAVGDIFIRDYQGNSTYAYLYAYHIYAEIYNSFFGGALKPNTDFTATLMRGATNLDTFTGSSDSDGWFYGWFIETPQSGDQINVAGGGITMSFIVASLEAAVDPALNRVTGTTSPGRRVLGYLEKNDWDWPISSCNYDGDCKSSLADGSGNFTLTTTIDLVRGDYAGLNIYDHEGHYQYAEPHAPLILADLAWPEVGGFWLTPGEWVTVVHKNSNNAVLETVDEWTSSADGEYWTSLWYDLEPGDHIEVGNGVITETMTVQNLTASVNNNTEAVIGTTPNGKLIVEFWDYQREQVWTGRTCREVNVSAGTYNLNYSVEGIEAADSADIRIVGPNGHHTLRWAHAFDANIYYDYDGYIWGFSLYPNSLVTVELWDGGTLVTSVSDTSWWNDGLYEIELGQNLTAGQRVVVSSGLTADVILPSLTVYPDSANNRLYGSAPANQPVLLTQDQHYKCVKDGWCGSWFDLLTTADGSGNYSTSLAGLSFTNWDTGQCMNLLAGGQCSYSTVTYYRPDEHAVIMDDRSSNQPVSADTHEPDNTYGEAGSYTGMSSHSFHTTGDVDWVAINITPGQVGSTHYLATTRLGMRSDTILELYSTNGTTLIATDDDGGAGYASRIAWTPSSAGTYYVKIKPYDSDSAANCGATYDFFVYNAQLFLPLARR